MKKKINIGFLVRGAIVAAIAIVILTALLSSESARRWFKDASSNYNGGLNRTVTVYDYNGNVIESYTGKFDVEYKTNGTVKFDIDGKRTVITGGIVINQEE